MTISPVFWQTQILNTNYIHTKELSGYLINSIYPQIKIKLTNTIGEKGRRQDGRR